MVEIVARRLKRIMNDWEGWRRGREFMSIAIMIISTVSPASATRYGTEISERAPHAQRSVTRSNGVSHACRGGTPDTMSLSADVTTKTRRSRR